MTELFLMIVAGVACGLVGFRLGWNAREQAAKKFVMNYVEQEMDRVKETVVYITVKREGTTFFVYDRDTDEFLAQGTNHLDITKVLLDRFPSKRFIA